MIGAKRHQVGGGTIMVDKVSGIGLRQTGFDGRHEGFLVREIPFNGFVRQERFAAPGDGRQPIKAFLHVG
jgi:hypothetical protein